ncbi:MAG TPA: beta-eliminating lyase-related protein [Thermoanaerobaculia bacterium]
MFDFRSDNTHGASPEITDAIVRASRGTVTSYGQDELTQRLRVRARELFETDCEILPVATGTGGNALSVAVLTPPWGGVFCHDDAHIHRDEMGAPEFYSGGAKTFPIAGAHGKLDPVTLARTIDGIALEGRTAKVSVVSLTQATEAGTVYSVDDLRALCDVAHARGCRVHMDGARFANAVVSAGASPADLTWRAGVDILVLGATKNGALAAELIVAFDTKVMPELTTRWHRGGQRWSKMRFLSAQLDAYFADGLWLRNARHANAMAGRLAAGVPELLMPVEANVVFARLAPAVIAALQEGGFLFYEWPLFGVGAVRFVCGFSTTEADVDALVGAVQAAGGR